MPHTQLFRKENKKFAIGRPLAVLAVVLLLFVVFFPWNVLRGPIGSMVTAKTGRAFIIQGDLDVRIRRTLQITMNDVRFDNAEWSDTPVMAKAGQVFISLHVWPLLTGKLKFAELGLRDAEASLERTADGKRNWTLAKSEDRDADPPEIDQIYFHNTRIRYRDALYEADITADINTDEAPKDAQLPTHITFKGSYRKADVAGEAHTGPVLSLRDSDLAFPAHLNAKYGATHAEFNGTVANIGKGGVVDADLSLSGASLSKLYPLLPVVLPDSKPYRITGRFKRDGNDFRYDNFTGVIGESDIKGSLAYLLKEPRPTLKATLESKVLDLGDLGPMIGLTPQQVAEVKAEPKTGTLSDSSKPPAKAAKVLPAKPFNLGKLNAMDADVAWQAQRIARPNQLPLEDMRTHIVLNDGELKLDPLEFGFAGGKIAAKITINARQSPMQVASEINLRNVKLKELFPDFDLMRSSFGTIGAQIKLKSHGASVAEWLGNANGDAAFAMRGGELSGLLLEAVNLNGAGIIKYLAFGDKTLPNRCSLAAFDVEDGLATARTMVFDTDAANIQGSGVINLKQEEVDLKLDPKPKHKSIFVARTPILLHGSFSHVGWDLEKGPLAARGAAAVALGAVSPPLALLALIETGPGEDADCNALMAEVPGAEAQSKKSAQPAALPDPGKKDEIKAP